MIIPCSHSGGIRVYIIVFFRATQILLKKYFEKEDSILLQIEGQRSLPFLINISTSKFSVEKMT